MKNFKKSIAPFAMFATVFTGAAAQAQPSAEMPKTAAMTTMDWTLKPQPVATSTAAQQTGVDLQAAIRASGAFNKTADNNGQRAIIYKPDTGKQWQESDNNRLRPEIKLWQTDDSSVSIRPKGRGVMIGIKIKTN